MSIEKFRTVLESLGTEILSRSLVLLGMACGALGAFGAGSHVVLSPSGDLVWEENGRPAFLVSTTAKWTNFRLDGDGLALDGDILRTGVLRYLVRQPPQTPGEVPQFRRAVAVAHGCDAAGKACATEPHCITVAGRRHLLAAKASVVTADEWAEVEIPLGAICKGVNPDGQTVPLAVLKRLVIGGQPRFAYRDVRIEY